MIIKYLKKELANYEKLVYDCSGETWFLFFSKQSLHYPMKKYSCDFGIFMPKHLAGQWLLNSYLHTISTGTSSIFATLRMVSICLPTAAAM